VFLGKGGILEDLFLREQRILDDALGHIIDSQQGLSVSAEIYEDIVTEYGILLEQLRKIIKISDKVSVGLLHDRVRSQEQIARLEKKLLDKPGKSLAEKRVRVQTFGNFEIFVDDMPLRFARTKTKELFAYLVMRRGALCNNNEIIAVIWEDKPDSPSLQNQFRHLVMDLTNVLRSVNAEDVLIRQRGFLAVVPEGFSCDMYDYCAANDDSVNSYMGEFMAQYGWAEFTNAYLDTKR